MSFPIECTACGKTFAISAEIYERRVAGKVVSIKCKQCGTSIRVDGTQPQKARASAPAAAPAPAPAPLAIPDTLWTVEYAGGEDLEVNEAALVADFRAGKITLTSLVWRDGMPEWLEFGKVTELARYLNPPADAPRPRLPTLVGLNADDVKSAPVSAKAGEPDPDGWDDVTKYDPGAGRMALDRAPDSGNEPTMVRSSESIVEARRAAETLIAARKAAASAGAAATSKKPETEAKTADAAPLAAPRAKLPSRPGDAPTATPLPTAPRAKLPSETGATAPLPATRAKLGAEAAASSASSTATALPTAPRAKLPSETGATAPLPATRAKLGAEAAASSAPSTATALPTAPRAKLPSETSAGVPQAAPRAKLPSENGTFLPPVRGKLPSESAATGTPLPPVRGKLPSTASATGTPLPGARGTADDVAPPPPPPVRAKLPSEPQARAAEPSRPDLSPEQAAAIERIKALDANKSKSKVGAKTMVGMGIPGAPATSPTPAAAAAPAALPAATPASAAETSAAELSVGLGPSATAAQPPSAAPEPKAIQVKSRTMLGMGAAELQQAAASALAEMSFTPPKAPTTTPDSGLTPITDVVPYRQELPSAHLGASVANSAVTPPPATALPAASPVPARPATLGNTGTHAVPVMGQQLRSGATAQAVTLNLEGPPTKRKAPVVIGVLLALIIGGVVAAVLATQNAPAPKTPNISRVPPPAKPSEAPVAVPDNETAPAPDALPQIANSAAPKTSASPNAILRPPDNATQSKSNASFADAFAEAAKRAASAADAGKPFDQTAANTALDAAAVNAVKCLEPLGPRGVATVEIWFEPTGQASNAMIRDAPFVGTSSGACVAAAMKRAIVPTFVGPSTSVRKRLRLE